MRFTLGRRIINGVNLIHVPLRLEQAVSPLLFPTIDNEGGSVRSKLRIAGWFGNANGGEKGADHQQGWSPARSATASRQVSA